MRFTLTESSNYDGFLYRGVGRNLHKSHLQSGGRFYADCPEDASQYGDIIQVVKLSSDASIFRGNSSYKFCKDNGLMDVEYDILSAITYGECSTLRCVDEELFDDGTDNISYRAFQCVACEELQKQGYDGAEWEFEDELIPHQFQIWNANVLTNCGTLRSVWENGKERFITESLVESSTEVDSEGNNLTQEQSQYFRDSEVRDHKGNLLVCYHGTESTFDTFEKGDIGFHFGTEKAANERREYHDNPEAWNVDKYYLNIKNYIDTYDFGDWDGLTVAQHILESRLLDLNDEEIRWLQVISSSGGYYDEATTKQVRDFLIGKGIDGFMYENAYEDSGSLSFIVFSPNQVKRVTNQSPTNSDNLNESATNGSIINIDVTEAEDIATQFVSAIPTYQSWIDTQGRFLDATDLGSHYAMIDEVFWQLTDKGKYNNVKPVELDPEDYNRMTDAIFESFLELGWIQIGLDCNFASMHKKPTSQQYDAVEKYLDYAFNNKNYKMAICIDNNGFHSVEYNLKEVAPEYVIGRIKRCFSSGALYEGINSKYY